MLRLDGAAHDGGIPRVGGDADAGVALHAQADLGARAVEHEFYLCPAQGTDRQNVRRRDAFGHVPTAFAIGAPGPMVPWR
jgi:hypothetical protein